MTECIHSTPPPPFAIHWLKCFTISSNVLDTHNALFFNQTRFCSASWPLAPHGTAHLAKCKMSSNYGTSSLRKNMLKSALHCTVMQLHVKQRRKSKPLRDISYGIIANLHEVSKNVIFGRNLSYFTTFTFLNIIHFI